MNRPLQKKETLQSAKSLNHNDNSLPLIISTDASATHAGTVLEQEHKLDDIIQTTTMEFYSKALPSITQVGSTFYRELKALFMALKYSKYKIQGRTLIAKTDHLAPVNAIENIDEEHQPTEQNFISYDVK